MDCCVYILIRDDALDVDVTPRVRAQFSRGAGIEDDAQT